MTPHTGFPRLDPTDVLPEPLAQPTAQDDREPPAEVDDCPPCPDESDGPRFSLPELIDQEAMSYRAWGTPVGDFLARKMDELAQMVRWTDATAPRRARRPHGGLGCRDPPAMGSPRLPSRPALRLPVRREPP